MESEKVYQLFLEKHSKTQFSTAQHSTAQLTDLYSDYECMKRTKTDESWGEWSARTDGDSDGTSPPTKIADGIILKTIQQ